MFKKLSCMKSKKTVDGKNISYKSTQKNLQLIGHPRPNALHILFDLWFTSILVGFIDRIKATDRYWCGMVSFLQMLNVNLYQDPLKRMRIRNPSFQRRNASLQVRFFMINVTCYLRAFFTFYILYKQLPSH
jgi:hypothetical protein